MANFGWLVLLDAGRLAEARVRVHVDRPRFEGQTLPVKHVTPVALDGPGEVRDLTDWLADELAHGRTEEGEGPAQVTEFFLFYGVPGLRRVVQFEPEWMLVDDLTLLTGDDPPLRARLGLGASTVGELAETVARAWEAEAPTLPPVVALLGRLPGWCLLSRADVAALAAAADRTPEDALHFPGEWEDLAYRHATELFDYAAVLFESLL